MPPLGRAAPQGQPGGAATAASPADAERDPATEQEPDPSRITDARGMAPVVPAVGPNGEPIDEGEPDPDIGNGAERLAMQRPGDGDLAAREPQAPLDGVVPDEVPQAVIDGSLEAADDMAAGDAENEDGLRDSERPGRPITPRRHGPYQPVGIRVGSFVLFSVAEAGANLSDNVFRSATGRKSDMFADASLGGTLSSNWSRHALELRVLNARTFHERFSSENDNRLEAQARGRLDLSRRTNIAGDVAYSYGQEARGAVNTPTTSTGDRPTVIQRRAGAEVNHRFNRLSLQLRGATTDYVYGTVPSSDPISGVDTTPTLNDRDYVQHEVGARAGWQFSPNLTLFSDLVLNNRRHEAPGAADGILRNSEGYRAQGGVAFEKRGNLQGEVSAGYASQTPDDNRLRTVSGFIYNGRLNWQPTGLTEVIFSANSDIGETTLAGSGGALTRTTGVEIRHALRRHVILIAGASYAVANFGGNTVKEESTVGRLGLEYYLSREMALLAGFQHTNFETNGGGRGYEDNTVRVGVRVRR